MGAATTYATGKGLDTPYYYGEILYKCGANRSYSSYTKYMSTNDKEQGSKILNAVINSNVGNASNVDYNTGVNADHLVLWAESHDTYANDDHETTYVSQDNIDKAYIIQASRKNAASLYLARPNGTGTTFGDVGTTYWKGSAISAINKFHNRYVDKDESVYSDDGKYFVNVRGTGSFAGAAIVNISGSNSATINVSKLQDGEYTDLVSNNTFNVSNGKVNVNFTNNACILIPKGGAVSPSSETSETSSSSVTVNYSSNVVLQNYDSSKYYYVYVFKDNSDNKWINSTIDHDALGFNLDGYTNFIIVESTSSIAGWNNKVWQTEDLTYNGTQQIFDCNTIIHKS